MGKHFITGTLGINSTSSGYQKGKLMESALVQLVTEVEKTFDQKQLSRIEKVLLMNLL